MAGILWIKYERFIRFRSPSISDNKKEIYRTHGGEKAKAEPHRPIFFTAESVDNHFIATPVRALDDRIIYQFEKWREIECSSRNVYNAFSVRCPRGLLPPRSDVHFSKRPFGRGSKKCPQSGGKNRKIDIYCCSVRERSMHKVDDKEKRRLGLNRRWDETVYTLFISFRYNCFALWDDITLWRNLFEWPGVQCVRL